MKGITLRKKRRSTTSFRKRTTTYSTEALRSSPQATTTNFASYPGGYRSYVSVTSFGPDYLPAYYTNYGPGCNVAAPGGDASISPAGTSAAQVLSTLPSELPAELGTDGADYGYMQGTSMACPHVSGVAALGLSYALAKGRHYTVDEFKSMLLTAVNDIDSYIIGGTKNGMVLRKIKAMAGSSSANGEMSGMEITKEFAIIARAVQAGNGGWL